MEDVNNEEIDKFLWKVKKGKISTEDKNILYNLVIDLKQKTTIQRNRFVLYYNIIPNIDITYTLANIGKSQGCSSSAIRSSLLAIRRSLISNKKEEFIDIIKRNE